MATWNNLEMQDSASPLMEQLLFFHDHTMLILTMITMMISYVMMTTFFNNLNNRLLLQGQMIELLWTIMPVIILMFIALPSMRLLYIIDEVNEPIISIKTIGHQWYWSYEYSDFKNIEFDSFIKSSESMFRLLDTDNHTPMPFNSQIRLITTAADVIHSWTIPTLGIKIDSTPGRINQTSFLINRSGLFFGQCSEICGTNHSFMPIVIESISPLNFIKWVNKN